MDEQAADELGAAVGGYKDILYEELDDRRIVRISLNRPKYRNAQNRRMLIELNDAFLRAEADDEVRVVILGGVGPVFSSGHDLGSPDVFTDADCEPRFPLLTTRGATRPGVEPRMLTEWHYFFEFTKRWRNLRKITIAQVQGPVYAAGLMLMWACDLIVGADDTVFADVVGTRLGMCGVEYFAHPWEFGPRKTKELMLTGDAMDVDEAHALGMVAKVFPRAELEDSTLAFSRRIAKMATMPALLIKESVNQTVDNMGFQNSLAACFTLHQLNHAHWTVVTDGYAPVGSPEYGVEDWRTAGPPQPARKDTVGG